MPKAGSSSPQKQSTPTVADHLTEPPAPGKVVWLKFGKNYWPALVLPPDTGSAPRSVREKAKPNQLLLRYFGSHEFQWDRISSMCDFEERREEMTRKGPKVSKKFQGALDEADEYLASGNLPPIFTAPLVDEDDFFQHRRPEEPAEAAGEKGPPARGDRGSKRTLANAGPDKESSPAGDQKPPPAKKRKLENPEKEKKREKRLRIMRIIGLAPRPMTS